MEVYVYNEALVLTAQHVMDGASIHRINNLIGTYQGYVQLWGNQLLLPEQLQKLKDVEARLNDEVVRTVRRRCLFA